MTLHLLSPTEAKWIEAFQSLCAKSPRSLRFYVIDGGALFVCKAGTPSDDFCVKVTLDTNAGAMLTDLHDDTDPDRRHFR